MRADPSHPPLESGTFYCLERRDNDNGVTPESRENRPEATIRGDTYSLWDRSRAYHPAPTWSDRSIGSLWWAACSRPHGRYRGSPPPARRIASFATLASSCPHFFSTGDRSAWPRAACLPAAGATSILHSRSRSTVNSTLSWGNGCTQARSRRVSEQSLTERNERKKKMFPSELGR